MIRAGYIGSVGGAADNGDPIGRCRVREAMLDRVFKSQSVTTDSSYRISLRVMRGSREQSARSHEYVVVFREVCSASRGGGQQGSADSRCRPPAPRHYWYANPLLR